MTQPTNSTNLQDILAARGANYGTFKRHATISQHLKDVIDSYSVDKTMPYDADQKEAIDMICHKLARIINGNADYADSWVDIAGYATLVADRLCGKVQ